MAKKPTISKGQRVWGAMVFLAGIGLGVLAMVVASDKIPLILHGVTTTGTVVSVDPTVRPSRRYGVVEFHDRGGTPRRTTTTSGNQHVGDSVPIIYIPSDPEHAGEHSFATTWAAMIVLPLLSVFLMIGGRAISRNPTPRGRPLRR